MATAEMNMGMVDATYKPAMPQLLRGRDIVRLGGIKE
jgi:hypothetical protein